MMPWSVLRLALFIFDPSLIIILLRLLITYYQTVDSVQYLEFAEDLKQLSAVVAHL
jgi:hypothetical protein